MSATTQLFSPIHIPSSPVATPNLSLPATPHMDESPKTTELQTPRVDTGIRREEVKEWDKRDARVKNGLSLGTGSASGSERSSLDMGPPLLADTRRGKEKASQGFENDAKNDEPEGIDVETLQRFRTRFEEMEKSGKEGDGWNQRDELLMMVHALLPAVADQMPFLQNRLAAQQSTIALLQQKAKISEQMTIIEKERLVAEKESWQSEICAIISNRDAERAANTNKRKILDLDLLDTQRQIDRLVNELRLLRPHVILNTQTLTPKPSNIQAPSPIPLPQYMPQIDRQLPRSTKTVMGDARTEHLLLAAKKIRSMKRHNKEVGRMTFKELKKNGVVGLEGGMSYKEGYGEAFGMSDEEDEPTDDEIIVEGKINLQKPRSKAPQDTPNVSKSKRGMKKPQVTANSSTLPQTPSRSRAKHCTTSSASLPQTTPGGSNFSDLLRAAELATRPSSPTSAESVVPVLSSLSATRSTRPRNGDDSEEERGSPKRQKRGMWSSGAATEKDSSSALDLLAQASQLDAKSAERVVQSSPAQPHTSVRLPASMLSQSSPAGPNGLGAPIDLTPRIPKLANQERIVEFVDSSMHTPKGRMRGSSSASETPYSSIQFFSTPKGPEYDEPFRPGPSASMGDVPVPNASTFASPSGKVVPGLGKYWHYNSEIPIKRVRSPYLKWTVEEDELLARAVAMHGEKWDLVSKGVPTRSYHQVRQRQTGAFDKKASKDKDKGDSSQKSSSTEKEEEQS
nr:hypothetical protein L203_02379 [Cryptococcus depauperatus CBS 7841]